MWLLNRNEWKMVGTINTAQRRRNFGLVLLLTTTVLSSAEGLVIQVSGQGENRADCLTFNQSQPCKTLGYALNAVKNLTRNDPSLRIEILDDVYDLNELVEISFNETRFGGELTLTTSGKNSRVNITCANSDVGIWMYRAQRVSFANLLWHDCGPNLPAVVTLWDSREIVFHNCTFQDNKVAGVNAFDSSVTVEDSVFRNNTSNFLVTSEVPYVHGKASSGGGAAFVFRHAKNVSVLVRRCSFANNSATFNDTKYYIAPSSNLSDFGEDGGGLLVTFVGTAENCQVTLDETHFYGNRATYGGALNVAAVNNARNNRFVVSNSIMEHNSGGQTGGGAVLSLWDSSTNISMTFRNCTVRHNWSRRGAGINVYYINFVNKSHDSSLVLDTVRFQDNKGYSSSAIRFASGVPFGNPIAAAPEIINCTFSDHVAEPVSYTAPLTSQRVSLTFKGLNVFENNLGIGAMQLENSNVDIVGSVRFVNNTGKRGGALTLMASQLKLHAGSEMLFERNHAELIGGAIAVLTHMMDEVIHVCNAGCFLTYVPRTPPSEWQTNISFIGNSAKVKGAAIYISSLDACLWDEDPPYYSWQKSLRWNQDVFVYRDNYLQSWKTPKIRSGSEYDIATDTARFEGEHSVEFAPGENVTLHLQALDQLDHRVHTVASLVQTNHASPLIFTSDNMHTLSPLNNKTLLLAYKVPSEETYEKLAGYPAKYKVQVTDFYSVLTNGYSFFIRPKHCPPGFKFDNTKCICDTEIVGVLSCGESGTVFLQDSYWAGVEEERLITYSCPFNYCNCTTQEGMPGCVANPSRMDDQCANGRRGKLCGACPGNHSVGLRWEQCIDDYKCSAWIVAPVIVLVVLLTVLVIWLNPSLSSELRGPLFFFQVIQFVVPSCNKVWAVIIFFANILNFGGPLVYIFDTCIAKGMDNLYMVALGYVMPLLTMLVFLVSYILSVKNVIRLRFRAHSSLHSFWLIILFNYHYLLETTFSLLNCVKVGEKYVFFYDGTINCFEGPHRGMAVLALIVMVLFIIPPPVIIVLLTRGIWKVDPQYASALTNGLRPRCLWWWAFDLSRRIILVAANVFITNYGIRQVHISLICLLIFAVHSNVQPYKRPWVNYQESVYLFCLCTMATLLVMKRNASVDSFLAIVLIVLSCYTLLLLLKKAYRFFRKRFDCLRARQESTRSKRYGTVDSEVLEKSLDPDMRERRDILDTIFSNSSEGGLENNSFTSK